MTTDAIEAGIVTQSRVGQGLFARIRFWLMSHIGPQYRITDKGLEMNFAASIAFTERHGARNAKAIGSAARSAPLAMKR